MKLITPYFICAVLLTPTLLFGGYVRADGCLTGTRTIEYFGTEIPITLSEDGARPTIISLPEEDLLGTTGDNLAGIEVLADKQKNNRFSLSVTEPYRGHLYIDGRSGETYTLNISSSTSCSDGYVNVIAPRKANVKGSVPVATSDPERETLMQYLWHAFDAGEMPPATYRRIDFDHLARSKRIVYSEGDFNMFFKLIYEGPRYTGYIFELVNGGREGYIFDQDSIDYDDPRIVALLGATREYSTIPVGGALDPAPEFVEDIHSHQSTGLFFVVSETK